MDGERFDEIVRRVLGEASRRGVLRAGLGTLVASGLAYVGLSAVEKAEAKKKKKRKKKKKKKKKAPAALSPPPPQEPVGCPAGTQTCGGSCCAPASCIAGTCCPSLRTCGTLCCPDGQRCGDPQTATCVAGQGTCATGADTCAGDNAIFCNGTSSSSTPPCVCVQATDGTTRCATPIDGIGLDDCGLCTTDTDCRGAFPGIVGVFCTANATGLVCGCPEGQNVCGRPCPTT